MTLTAYRFALDPTPAQERALRSHAGAARVAFNWGLARVRANLGQREAERSYGIGEAELTPAVGWSLPALRKAWNAAKTTVAPWWGECSKEAFNTGLDQLARGLKGWDDSRRGKRKGKRVGFPRFRSKRKVRPSVRFTTGAFRCERRYAVLPRIGTIVVEDLHVAGMVRNRRLARHVADASFGEFRRQVEYKAGWRGGTVIVADRWFASSKTCSGCGAVRAKLALSERTFRCTICGLVIDRDLNAARNLAAYGKQQVAASGAETLNGRGADRQTGQARQVAMRRQPGGTAPAARETGTIPPQDGTAIKELTHVS